MDSTIRDEIISNIKLFNNLTDTSQDDLLGLLVDKACQSILNLTNRVSFPEQLKYIVFDIVNDTYFTYLQTKNDKEGTLVNSLSEDGRSVTFGANSSNQAKLASILKENISNRAKEISRYKLLYKVECKHEQS